MIYSWATSGMGDCLECGKPTTNPKFCSRSCSAIFTNKATPKRSKNNRCLSCGEPILSRHQRCPDCRTREVWEGKTVGDYRRKMIQRGHHLSGLHTHIRAMCRYRYKDLQTKPCAVCGYSKHVELAHIRPLRDFPDETPLEVVNGRENVVQLCRNCHWELDNSLINIPEDLLYTTNS